MSRPPRPVTLTREDIVAIEEAAHARITAGAIAEGFQLLGRCLAWRYESGIAGEVFTCIPDESGGLAEVVELRGYSRKVPGCA